MNVQTHLAELLDEPGDKTVIVTRGNGIYTVYERDDQAAAGESEYDDERWSDVSDADGDPVTWRTALNYAEAVFPLGDPLIDPSAE